ncbi:MAG: hypothetical protein ACOYOR_02105 [Flavobacterium psychrophilum]|jgi:hypothetical protein
MFHVERNKKRLINTAFALILWACSMACSGSRNTVQIQDYLLVGNGIELQSHVPLTAFVFENNQKNPPIEKFLSLKFKLSNYFDKQFWVTLNNAKFKLVVYDAAEFEKFIGSGNYAQINQEPENAKYGNQPKFIAFSMVSSTNEDCLSDQSLYQHLALTYLKNLKDDYCNQQ